MTEAIIRAGEATRQVHLKTAAASGDRVTGDKLTVTLQAGSCDPAEHPFDAVINWTGLEVGSDLVANPMLAALANAGLINTHPSRLGVPSARNANRQATPKSRSKASTWSARPAPASLGETVGVLFIFAQGHRTIPAIVGSA
jgi:uncharacterized NAD(P)/FAD-binding protein YdhS